MILNSLTDTGGGNALQYEIIKYNSGTGTDGKCHFIDLNLIPIFITGAHYLNYPATREMVYGYDANHVYQATGLFYASALYGNNYLFYLPIDLIEQSTSEEGILFTQVSGGGEGDFGKLYYLPKKNQIYFQSSSSSNTAYQLMVIGYKPQ